MLEMIFATAIATIIVLYKLNLHKLIQRYPWLDGGVDMLISGGLAFLFAGTFGGLVVGFGAGLIVSGWLFLVRLLRKRPSVVGRPRTPEERWSGE